MLVCVTRAISVSIVLDRTFEYRGSHNPRGGGGVLPCMGCIGMCGAKGYGFSAVLVINRVRVLGSGPHTPTQFFFGVPPPPRGT